MWQPVFLWESSVRSVKSLREKKEPGLLEQTSFLSDFGGQCNGPPNIFFTLLYFRHLCIIDKSQYKSAVGQMRKHEKDR